MSRCPGCGQEQPVIRIDNGDGTFSYPPVIGNVITIPADPGETPFEATAGQGVTITAGGDNGHGPTIAVCAGEGVTFDDDNCLTFDTDAVSPAWTTANASQPVQGIVVFPGGVDGHAPTFALAIHPDSDNVSIANGQLLVECCEDIAWQGGTSTPGITVTPGDNPTGEPDNGHRPSFGLSVDGTTISFNDDGQLVALGGGGVADLCPSIQALPTVPAGVNVAATVGVGDDGLCYQVDTCIIYADAGSLPWDANNPAWVDPAGVDKWCELRLDNGVSGCEIWRNLADTNGVLQWHQVS